MGGFTKFVMYIILLITFLGLINMIFNLHRFAFYGEFLILLVLLLVAMISALGINNDSRWAWILLTLFFGFVFLDMLLIKAISTEKVYLFLPFIIVTIVGFFISLFSIKKEKVEAVEEVEKEFSPGKYIASKSGTKYHAPKCDWAKKIKKANAVWFDSKEEAKKAGYKKDDCVK
ncbi:MAG: hypothetical protein IH934_06400 [Nanoarchaeota archaeon]|nr:hypothetical protein [Nanoarchaeota archaeon]